MPDQADESTPIVPAIVENRGRFQPGNKAAVGRQSRQQRLRNAIFAAVTFEDIKAITEGLVTQAKAGDLDAVKVLLGFIGKGAGGPAGPLVAIQNNTGTGGTPVVTARPSAADVVARLRAEREHMENSAGPSGALLPGNRTH